MRFLTSRMRVVDQVAFAADGRRLFGAGTTVPALRPKPDNRGIDVWDLTGGPEPADRLFPDELISGLTVHPAGRWLYVGTGYKFPDESTSDYFAVDLATGGTFPLGLRAGNRFVLAAPPSGEWFVVFGYVGDWRTNRLLRWRQPPAAAPVKEWECKPRSDRFFPCHIACDPDGAWLITHELEGGKTVQDQVYELGHPRRRDRPGA
jgi:hypothetical protein